MKNIIHIENINFSYEKTSIFSAFSLNIPQGNVVSILGPSGCGKTTLLHLIAGHINPNKGIISFDNVITKGKKREIATVFQEDILFPHLNVKQNISLPLQIRNYSKDSIDKEVSKISSLLHLDKILYSNVNEISGGQRKRVNIARSIIHKPKIVLLDEPLTALDQVLREDILFNLLQFQKLHNITFVYVTHNQEEAFSSSDLMVILNNKGEISRLDKPNDIYSNPIKKSIAEFIGIENIYNRNYSNLFKHKVTSEYFCFHSENVKLNKPSNSNFITLKVGVYKKIFKGKEWKIGFELLNDKRIKIELLASFFSEIDIPNVGDEVNIYVDKRNILELQ